MEDPVEEKKTETPVEEKVETKTDPVVESVKEEKPITQDKKDVADGHPHVTDMWGDSRMNPHFLTVAGFFGVTERDYSNAEPKINAILRWAEDETGSKDVGDIVKKISETSKGLQSPGMGEKAYAILYRYIRLASTKRSVEKEMDAYKKTEA
jgi:hypothetical protein